jgi:hypothetical protein
MTEPGGLIAPGFAGLGQQAEQELHEVWDTFDNAEVILTKNGFAPMDKPNFNKPQINAGSLHQLTGQDLTQLFETVVAWHGYANNLAARLKGGALQCENEKRFLAVELKRGMLRAASASKEKAPSDKKMEQDILLDPRYKEITIKEQLLEQQRYQMDAWVDTLTEYRKMVSRQVEIRRQELEGTSGGGGYRPNQSPNVPNGGRMR